ncbi:MAG: XdhC family protein [Polaromonas sp.]|uniref:XdhC family protein n=1 Tax=Polaromonas sp. TaxID=1869339 RepID=UPI0025FA3D85|nr:XdhC family protein [Polaromonas sp.]MBI2726530.1 XdhC family protein [Polaromonas sp.]
MENVDVSVLRTLLVWRRKGHRALLATVLRTWGSSPRPVGSIMAICDSGSVIGSVSGGCIEDDLHYKFAEHCKDHEASGKPPPQPERISYGVSADEAHRFGLPCGGTMELVLEYDPDAQKLEELVSNLEQGYLVRRRLDLLTGAVDIACINSPESTSANDTRLINSFGPEYRMLLIGAGQLTQCLAVIAVQSGFAVTVCDPRSEYADGWDMPGVAITREMPDDVVSAFQPDLRTCVIALTHDPKLDDLALLEAIASPAFYVGAIGSRRNSALRKSRLIEHFGQSEDTLKRLRGPIGLYVGSKTPPEIAVSVMAEVLAIKNDVALPPQATVGQWKSSKTSEFTSVE